MKEGNSIFKKKYAACSGCFFKK